MARKKSELIRTARGLVTVARRHGFGSFGYLVSGVAWPRAAFRFGWGPAAPPLMQGVFAAAGELAARKPERHELADLGLAGDDGAAAANDVTVDEVEALMDRAHAAGVTGVSKSFRSLVRDRDGSLRFGDLSAARRHPRESVAYASARDSDRRDFNRTFGATLMTEASARRAIQESEARVPPDQRAYAPIDFGKGLTVGRMASDDRVTASWDELSRRIVAPLVAGQRILDLGSNNGYMPLMMLRAGAAEVMAIEYTPEIADLARLNARILSWRDVRPYNIQVLTGDVRLFLSEDLGRFDVVTAFRSLYYLQQDDLARIVRKAASMNAVLVLQANEGIGDGLFGKTLDLHRMMRDNGYPEIAVHTPAGSAYPLLVGYSDAAAVARSAIPPTPA